MSKIVYLNEQIGGIETLSAALGDGRTLGLNPNQLDTIKNNVKTQIMNFKPVSEPTPIPMVEDANVVPDFNTIKPEIPVVPPVSEPQAPVVPVVPPVTEPAQEPTIIPNVPAQVIKEPVPTPVENPSTNVEIVSNEPKKTDYDNLMDEIAALNTKYQNDLQAILHKYQEKMNTFETEINDLKGKAEEHLKNAQAAETIATIAHQNAQNVTSSDNGIL